MEKDLVHYLSSIYTDRVNAIKEKNSPDKTSSFLDIAQNMIGTLNLVSGALKEGKKWEELGDIFTADVNFLNAYLFMINKFPDFAQSEYRKNVYLGESYFPDIRKLTANESIKIGYKTPNHAYIALAKKRLESKVI